MTYKERYDLFLLRNFKYIVVVLAVFSFVLLFLFYGDSLSFGHLLYCICCSYAAGFCILGIPTIAFRRTSLMPRWKIVMVVLGLGLIIGLALWFLFEDSDPTPNIFITGFTYIISWARLEVNIVTVVAGVYVIMFMVTLATYGVLEVLSALLGQDYHRVLLSLMKPQETKLKKRASNLFNVPKVIDVDDVTLNPRVSEGFDIRLFRHLYKYVLMVGVVAASYLFLNPVFLQAIPLQDMMVIMILLSLFVMVLVIPVNLTRTLGAEAKSAGNRPFVLWKGMKDRLFHPGFYLLLFLTLLWVCLFTGEDIVRILLSYVGYVLFMFLTSVLVSFIYVNSFYPDLNKTIADRFEDAKKKL